MRNIYRYKIMVDFSGKTTAKTANTLSGLGLLMTIGIVFGDIGTSPLYVMKAITHTGEMLTGNYIIGAISCVIWTLTLQTTVKYVCVALRADNNGEGGILALYALLRRHKRRWLYVIAAIGAGTLVADGVITPSITVVTAMEGLKAMDAEIPVLPIAAAVITVLFFIQRFGTGFIGKFFGPFMLVWFLMLGIAGGCAVHLHPDVLKAFNPYYAVCVLVESPEWFLVLGAVFLCTTGAEALYSDLGHCGRKNITVSWAFVKTMLILNYLGQGAWILANPEAASGQVNPFYAIIPNGLLLFSDIMPTCAAVIASQALISGSFSIFSEAMNLSLWPRMKIKHPTNVKGQLFIPAVNNAMYVGVMLTMVVFRTSDRMEAAYGLAITVTMLMTTILISFYLRMKGLRKPLVLLFFIVFFTIEGVFFTANMSKFMEGGWFTVMIAGFLSLIMLVWINAMRIRRKHISFKRLDDYYGVITDIKADREIPKCASNLVYINHSRNELDVDDRLIYSIVNKQPKRADHYWMLHLEFVDSPDTLEYVFTPLVKDTLFSVSLRIGFRIEPRVSLYFRNIIEDIVANGELDLTSGYPSLRKRGIAGDFRFFVIHRVYYPETSKNKWQNMLMGLYGIIRVIGTSEAKALGLDTTNVVVERVPMIINKGGGDRRISRVFPEDEDGGELTGNGVKRAG